MSRKGRGKRPVKILVILAFAACVGGAGWGIYKRAADSGGSALSAYKEETVRRGSVETGINESGTVEFGTTEQVFSVAEVSSSSDSSSGSDSTGSQSGGGNAQGGMGGQSMQSAASGTSGMSSTSGSGSEDATALTVEEVYAAAGQVVEEGDKLLKITEESIEDYREQLEAAVAEAELLVVQEEINVESKRAEADYNYAMYIAKGETAEATYQATITSLEKAVSDIEEEIEDEDDEDELEELEAELQIAKNNLATQSIEAKQVYETAMNNYKYADQLYEIDTNGLEDDLNDAKEELEEAQANLEEFESQIGDGIVYAEASGTVTEIAYSAGDSIVNDETIVTYVDGDSVTMTVSVSQDDISQISIGDEVTVNLTAYKDETFPAEVSGIATSATAGSSTVNYSVTVRFTGDVARIYSGMTGEATFAGKTVTDVLYISNKAVNLDGTRSWVKVLGEDGELEEVTIQTGFSNGSVVEVLSGLEEGQTVVIESQVGQ